MADDLNLDVIIRLAVEGARKSREDLNALMDELGKTGNQFDKASAKAREYSRALENSGKGVRSSASALDYFARSTRQSSDPGRSRQRARSSSGR